MPINPALKPETLDSPIQRGNPLNDPQFSEVQGYNSFDLTNTQVISPRFGEYTPNCVFETVPGDRHLLRGNSLSVLNQIEANLYSKVNEYMDYVYVPMRCVFPYNYDKMIPNPTKGDDLPWKALPQIPFLHIIGELFNNSQSFDAFCGDDEVYTEKTLRYVTETVLNSLEEADYVDRAIFLNSVLYATQVLSRGQLLDYLGLQYDCQRDPGTSDWSRDPYRVYKSRLQEAIDDFYDALQVVKPDLVGIDQVERVGFNSRCIWIDEGLDGWEIPANKVYYRPRRNGYDWSLTSFRAALSDSFEKGLFIWLGNYYNEEMELSVLFDPATRFVTVLRELLEGIRYEFAEDIEEPFGPGYVNPLRIVGYQLAIAEYMSNDTIDNVFNADLWMQNIRSIMFPANNGITQEKTFDYNGVDTEYDLFTTGAFHRAFLDSSNPQLFIIRIFPFLSNVFFLRRSLRYGDYFATGRPNLLAVGQLGIPVENGMVNPIRAIDQLVMTRFLNASNWIGARPVNYFKAMYGVTPSDTGCHPYFLGHRKIEMERDITTNTADNQGRQSTNLKSTVDGTAFDVFIDDFGVVIGVTSFDVLPIYPAGIDRNFTNSDRFSMFNSMLQNVGDQEIDLSELTGDPNHQNKVFAYMVRYAQYKFGQSRAHGAFVNNLPSFVMLYPAFHLAASDWENVDGLHIDPEFIRDKPFYFDQLFKVRAGLSPGQYYHFQAPVTNVHMAARKMQYQPPVLFG